MARRQTERSVEAQGRARLMERAAAARELETALGRYALERIHRVEVAPTSLLGNADILQQVPELLSPQSREAHSHLTCYALAPRRDQAAFLISCGGSERG